LPRSAASLLRDENIETIHVGEIGMSAARDADIIQIARGERRIVITLDADFHTLLALTEATSPSVIRIRIENLRAQALVELLMRVVKECQEDIEKGVAITVETGRIRIRHLPLLPSI
jgi:predicted nuclease of predicted toxin-antitoxin system